jgi:hypothetical protein
MTSFSNFCAIALSVCLRCNSMQRCASFTATHRAENVAQPSENCALLDPSRLLFSLSATRIAYFDVISLLHVAIISGVLKRLKMLRLVTLFYF